MTQTDEMIDPVLGRIDIVQVTTQGNLQIQCSHYQITNGIFHRTRRKKFKQAEHSLT